MKSLKQYTFVWLLSFVLFTSGCSFFQDEDKQIEIEKLFVEVEELFENYKGRKLKNLISEDYTDEYGRTKQNMEGMITYTLLQNQEVHILARLTDTSFPNDKYCVATVYAAMAGSAGSSTEMLNNLRTDVYKFTFRLSKVDGDWLLKKAEWEPAGIDDVTAIWGSVE